MTDTSGGEGDEEEDFSSDFEQSFCNETSDHLYLFIETLTGTSFEMKVSPFETIVSIKAKLQQLEGIPVSQQHLLYNNTELPSAKSLYECEVPDGATLKLVLSMRGGPINTRRVALQEQAGELQQVVEQSKEELLEHIPEGGHVTVLVFRDGDQINLYHVLERPDGSYSPLSDSWSGSSIRNLFAENEDPEIQERLQENANTMSKMQDIRCRIDEKKSKRLSKTESKRTRSKRTPLSILPPLKNSEENEGDFKNLTSVSEIHKSSNHFQTNRLLNRREPLPRVKDVKTSIDLPDTAPASACKALSARGRGPQLQQRYEHCSLPARVQGSSSRRWISADVGELKKTVDSQDSVSPVLLSSVRSEKSEFKKKAEKLTQGFTTRRPRLYSPPSSDTNMSRGKSLKNVDEPTFNVCDSVAPLENRRVPSLHLENEKSTNMAESLMSQHKQEADKQMSSLHQEPQSCERRLASRGRVKALASPLRRTVLASPKLNSPRSGRGSAPKLRPSYQTRPLSGPKHRGGGGGGGGRARCGGADCRKKLTITNTFVCRCSASFCPLHRHPESHACTFDYKAEGRRLLKAANPLVSLPKLPKI